MTAHFKSSKFIFFVCLPLHSIGQLWGLCFLSPDIWEWFLGHQWSDLWEDIIGLCLGHPLALSLKDDRCRIQVCVVWQYFFFLPGGHFLVCAFAWVDTSLFLILYGQALPNMWICVGGHFPTCVLVHQPKTSSRERSAFTKPCIGKCPPNKKEQQGKSLVGWLSAFYVVLVVKMANVTLPIGLMAV